MDKQIYGKYRRRVAKEGFIKSLFFGIIFASAATVITAFLCWFFDFKPGLFISIGVFFAVTAAVTCLFYFLRYRPSVKQIACRMDELGLEERMLTMTELEGDNSEIAVLQRADAMKALGTVNHMMIKIALSAALVVPFVICCVLGAGMLTVSSLHYADIIPSGLITLSPDYVPGVYTVTYSVEEGGEGQIIYWTGDWSEVSPVSERGDRVVEGGDAKAVYAIPAENWAFVSWSDGVSDPYRHDTVIDEDIFVQAIFEPIEPDPDQQTAEEEAKDEEQEQQGGSESQEQQQGGEGDDSQDGEPQESEDGDSSQEDPDGQPSSRPDSSSGGARDLTSQQIVDGQTYYGDQFDDAYNQMKDRLSSDGNIPDELKGYIEDYYQSIETDSSTGGAGSQSGSGSDGGN